MSAAAQHTDPIVAAFAAMAEQIAANVAARLKAERNEVGRGVPAFDWQALGIEPLRAYDAKEVAHILGTRRVASVYEIPEDELPRVRRVGSSVGFLGINILAYMHRLPPVDLAAAVEQLREHLLTERPTAIRPLHPESASKTRVL